MTKIHLLMAEHVEVPGLIVQAFSRKTNASHYRRQLRREFPGQLVYCDVLTVDLDAEAPPKTTHMTPLRTV